jgi:hypothetical protein
MSADTKYLRYPTDYNLQSVELITPLQGNNNVVNLLPFMLEIDLYEDLYSPTISGEIVVQDSLGLMANYLINGTEFIRIKLQKSSETQSINKSYRLYKISKRVVGESNNYEVYVLNFCSEEFLLSEQYRISKSATGKEIYKTVTDILTNYLKTKKPTDIDTTYGVYDFVLPNKKLFETINWLTTYAQFDAKSGADMLFFENGTGYNFKSLQNLYNKNPYQTYKFDPKNVGDDMNQKVSNVLEFDVLDFFDTLGALSNGTFSNKVITIDPIKRKYDATTGVFNYADYVKSVTPMNGYGVTNNYTNRLGKTMYDTPPETLAGLEVGTLRLASSNADQKKTKYISQKPDSVANDIRIEKYLPNRVAQLALANYMRIKITIAGDPTLVAGQTVNFNMFKTDPKTYTQGGSNASRDLDPFYSGKYLVSAVRHIVKNNSYITVVELCKESISQSYPSFDSSNSLLQQFVNGVQV